MAESRTAPFVIFQITTQRNGVPGVVADVFDYYIMDGSAIVLFGAAADSVLG